MLHLRFRRGLRLSAAFLLTLAMSLTVSAQQGDQTGGVVSPDQTGTGGTGTTGGTAGSSSGTGEASAFGTLDAAEIFSGIERGDAVGSTANSGAGFSNLDANAAGGRSGIGGIGGIGGGGLGGLGALFGLGGAGAGTQSTKPAIRTRLRSAIDVPLTPPSVVQSIATRQLRSIPNQPQLRGINVRMQGRTAVISGVVSSERDRRMGELLLRLQPGVGSVDNGVVVMPQ